jgi:hypothetical protein
VDEIQVYVVQLELLEAPVECIESGVVSVLAVCQLGRDEQVLAGDPAGGNGLTHADLLS